MNQEKIIAELTAKYPEKHIIKNDEEEPTEILCEVKATEDHPTFSMAVAVIEKSIPHFHKHSTEEYTVIKGELVLHIGNQSIPLHPGETFIIPPGKIHWAEGNETWVSCFSQPGWTLEDHILAPAGDAPVGASFKKLIQ